MNVLITGGAGVLGRKIAEDLLAKGHGVFVLDKAMAKTTGQAAEFIRCDLGNQDDLSACFNELITRAGRVDVLINCASVRQFKMLADFTPTEIRQNIQVDFIAPVILANLCLPRMEKNNFGRIINISSISAYSGFSTGSLYCSSKNALITLGESLGKELKKTNGSVTINTICPGSFSKTDGTTLQSFPRITGSIVDTVDRIIHSGMNGRVINIFSFQNKLMESLRFLLKAFQMIIS